MPDTAVREVEKLMQSFYRFISGFSYEKRDWNGFRKIFSEDARLITRYCNEGEWTNRISGVDEYVERLENFLTTKDFFEVGYSERVDVFQNIAQMHSRYEARHMQGGDIVKKGVNFIQFQKEGDSWRIIQMLWQDGSFKK